MIHDEDNNITYDELVIVNELLKTSKQTCLNIQNEQHH